ncbi:MAG TPA: 3-isopropylmalate dehydrogenase [Rhodanobacter sp.]|nr:3-isopropylmalate dehydrogenase [Rhodanobacter sp.]
MKARIVTLPGDGVGPEVTAAAVAVLKAVAARYEHVLDFDEQLIGGAAIDACGKPLPEASLAACQSADAVLLGAVGGPKWSDPNASVRPEQGLLGLRAALGVYANLRPLQVHPALTRLSPLKNERLHNVDVLFVRELTGGAYFGVKTRTADTATDECKYTVVEIERVVRRAFELARGRRGHLTSVDKANVLETSRLWRSTVQRLAADYPDVTVEHQLVDSMAMLLLTQPSAYDVVVTENLFGDILTDEAAALAGSLGLLPSASLGDRVPSSDPAGHLLTRKGTPYGSPSTGEGNSVRLAAASSRMGLYEPIHGSAPDIAGSGVANPIGAILSAALLLRHSLQLETEAVAIEASVDQVLRDGPYSRDLGGAAGTDEVLSAVLAALDSHAKNVTTASSGTRACA